VEDESPEVARAEEATGSELGPAWHRVLHLPCEVAVELGIPDCRIGDVVQLKPGAVLDTGWKVGRDLPLYVNQQAVAWVEFEVMSGHLAVRVTELADDPAERSGRRETETSSPEAQQEHAA
jgi:flagellar motor switch protein FliN/FliY